MAFFNLPHFVNFRAHMLKKNCEVFAIVKDKTTGQVTMTGDSKAAFSHLSEVEKREKRTSRDWVPIESPPQLPMAFSNLLQYQQKVRTYASALLRYFMDKKQKLGKVIAPDMKICCLSL